MIHLSGIKTGLQINLHRNKSARGVDIRFLFRHTYYMTTEYFLYIDELGNAFRIHAEGNSLLETQQCVDGLISIVDAEINGIATDMVVNDMGLFRNDFMINPIASTACQYDDAVIVGPVVLTKHDGHGATIGYTDEEINAFGLEITGTFHAEEMKDVRDEILDALPEDTKNALIRPL